MSQPLSRRTFLLGALAAPVVAPSVVQLAGSQLKDKVRLGIIGCGGRGEGNWSALTGQEGVVLCDVDLANTARAAKAFPKAEIVQDFRRVIDRKDIDAVVVSTPDHWHAIPSMWAMQTGKHVYCEKPLAHTVEEVRMLSDEAKKRKLVTQMGTQIHAGDNYRRVVELVQAGAIGKIKKVDVWCEKRPSPGHLTSTGTPPSTLDYDLWLGPAAARPFDPHIVPFNWRWWWEFGTGVLGDMACHYMDLAHWTLDLRTPDRVASTGTTFPDADNKVPVELRVDYHYPSRGDKPAVDLTWWHGITGPRDASGQVQDLGMSSGVYFQGEEGQILADYGRHKLLPESKFADYKRPPQTIAASVGHHQEWINGILNGTPTTCNWDYSGALAETVLLGNVPFRLGHEIEWDSKRLRVKNAKEADWAPLVRYSYRGPWKLKG